MSNLNTPHDVAISRGTSYVPRRGLSLTDEMERIARNDLCPSKMRDALYLVAGNTAFRRLQPEVLPGFPLALQVSRPGLLGQERTSYVFLQENGAWRFDTNRH